MRGRSTTQAANRFRRTFLCPVVRLPTCFLRRFNVGWAVVEKQYLRGRQLDRCLNFGKEFALRFLRSQACRVEDAINLCSQPKILHQVSRSQVLLIRRKTPSGIADMRAVQSVAGVAFCNTS